MREGFEFCDCPRQANIPGDLYLYSAVAAKLLPLLSLIQRDQGVKMNTADLNLRRPWRRIVISACTLVMTGLLFRCGSDADDNKNDGGEKKVPVAVPTDWDGKTDWQNSQWKVTDE
jgi:hypothetical protein